MKERFDSDLFGPFSSLFIGSGVHEAYHKMTERSLRVCFYVMDNESVLVIHVSQLF